MINILLVGYGKMGKEIADNASFINGNVNAIYDPFVTDFAEKPDFNDIDVAIEFTHPDSGFDNVSWLLSHGIPVVTGTTGWFHRLDELKEMYSPMTHTLVYGANFSVGMNLLYMILTNATKMINNVGLYDVYGYEAHHKHKADAPSGTAKVLAEIILQNMSCKDKVVYDITDKKLDENEFNFSSIRAGSIFGYHEIGFDSDFDEIKLIHNAKSRKGFAVGALLAAQFAVKEKGYFNFKEIVAGL
jgi:4-hydroxy-tetrahydrodipicolinate reductase